MARESNSDTSNNMGDRNHLKITKKIPEKHTGKTRHHETTKIVSHIVNCTRTKEGANEKVQNIFYGRINITCSTNFT
jgi:hypothetical protein